MRMDSLTAVKISRRWQVISLHNLAIRAKQSIGNQNQNSIARHRPTTSMCRYQPFPRAASRDIEVCGCPPENWVGPSPPFRGIFVAPRPTNLGGWRDFHLEVSTPSDGWSDYGEGEIVSVRQGSCSTQRTGHPRHLLVVLVLQSMCIIYGTSISESPLALSSILDGGLINLSITTSAIHPPESTNRL